MAITDRLTLEQARALLENKLAFVHSLDYNSMTLVVDGKFITIFVDWEWDSP